MIAPPPNPGPAKRAGDLYELCILYIFIPLYLFVFNYCIYNRLVI